MNYLNEFDPGAAQWLRELVDMGEIDGRVDERDIRDVRARDIADAAQCHFFAGIGGWPLAFRLAGWDTARSVWSASLPCQPFSAAGKRAGADDERHLWPAFHALVEECRPAVVVGEQVASKDGRDWLSAVFDDLEALGYAVAGADLCAASISAPHIRQRLYWAAVRPGWQPDRMDRAEGVEDRVGLANAGGAGLERRAQQPAREELAAVERGGAIERLEITEHQQPGRGLLRPAEGDGAHGSGASGEFERSVGAGGLGDSECTGKRANAGAVAERSSAVREARSKLAETAGDTSIDVEPSYDRERDSREYCIAVKEPWSDIQYIPCLDNKARPIPNPETQSGVFPLADGLPKSLVPRGDIGASLDAGTQEARIMRLKGYGNAIVPALAAEFLRAAEEAMR